MKNVLINSLLVMTTTLFAGNLSGQNKNGLAQETYTVNGNCEMCKNTIEKAAKKKGVKKAVWETDTKKLSIEYDAKKTNSEEILRRVAYAGYDNEKYLAPEAAYKNIHGCCQYERQSKPQTTAVNHENHKQPEAKEVGEKPIQKEESGVKMIYDQYFRVKDALVKSNSAEASKFAVELLNSISTVNMSALNEKEHETFMKYADAIKKHSQTISSSKDLEKQRNAFGQLSDSMYELMKEIKPGYEVYLDHCPMYNDGKGANWISKEKPIKNPFYGSKMMTCGNVKETIK